MSNPYKKIPVQIVNKIIYKNRTNDVIENLSRSTLIPFSNLTIDSNENIKLKSIPILKKENKFLKLVNNVVNLSSYINCASHLNSIDTNLLCSLNTINIKEKNNNENKNKNIFKKFNNIISDQCHSLYFSGKNLNDNENINDNESDYQEIISNVTNESYIEKNNVNYSSKIENDEEMDDLRKSQIISEKIKEKEDNILMNKLELEKLKQMQNLLNENIKNKNKSRKSSPINKTTEDKFIINKTLKTNKQNYLNKVNGNNKKNNIYNKTQQINTQKYMNNNYNEINKKKELLLKLKKKIENISINSEETSSFHKNDEIESSQNNSELNNSETSIRDSQLKHLSNRQTIKKKSFDIIESYLD